MVYAINISGYANISSILKNASPLHSFPYRCASSHLTILLATRLSWISIESNSSNPTQFLITKRPKPTSPVVFGSFCVLSSSNRTWNRQHQRVSKGGSPLRIHITHKKGGHIKRCDRPCFAMWNYMLMPKYAGRKVDSCGT